VDVTTADTMPEGTQRWLDWHRVVAPDNALEIAALEADQGRAMAYVRVVARRTAATIDAAVTTVETTYDPHALL
jgi:hypothetical protein